VSTKRDLVEAHAFSRRRLVTAFVSGAPGGREVEPVRPGRTVVGGLALGVLLVAGAAIASFINPPTPQGWLNQGIVLAKETGARYVVTEDGEPLRPVINSVSAQLILGSDVEPTSVERAEIDKQELGDPIGIFGAPDSLPSTELLVPTGWTACTNPERGMQVRIDRETGAGLTPTSGVVVEDPQGGLHVIGHAASDGGAHRYAFDDLNLVNQTSLSGSTTFRVSNDWLNLFPEGPALDESSFAVEGAGEPPSYADQVGGLDGATVGDVVELNGNFYLLGREAPLVVGPFAAQVYQLTTGEAPSPIGSLDAGTEVPDDLSRWPETFPERLAGNEACAVLDATAGEPARTLLAGEPAEEASAAQVGDAVRVSVAPGLGAYVRTAGHGEATGGQPWVLDSAGQRYRLGGEPEETATLLGYGSYPVPTIPDAWIERFGCGPELSQLSALAAPNPTAESSCGR
jgi:type VII secretion protein EccB